VRRDPGRTGVLLWRISPPAADASMICIPTWPPIALQPTRILFRALPACNHPCCLWRARTPAKHHAPWRRLGCDTPYRVAKAGHVRGRRGRRTGNTAAAALAGLGLYWPRHWMQTSGCWTVLSRPVVVTRPLATDGMRAGHGTATRQARKPEAVLIGSRRAAPEGRGRMRRLSVIESAALVALGEGETARSPWLWGGAIVGLRGRTERSTQQTHGGETGGDWGLWGCSRSRRGGGQRESWEAVLWRLCQRGAGVRLHAEEGDMDGPRPHRDRRRRVRLARVRTKRRCRKHRRKISIARFIHGPVSPPILQPSTLRFG